MTSVVLSADLGGTNLRMAAVTIDGRQTANARSETPDAGEADEIVKEIVGLVRRCRSEVGPKAGISGLALAVPALIDSSDGTIFNAPNLPRLNGSDISRMVAGAIGLPVVLENDANAAAVGEHWLGASKGCRSAISVTLGTGVGGGLILDNVLWRGAGGTAGEIGHICVEPEGHTCGCGSRGCLEQYASATAVVRMAHELAPRFPGSSVSADLTSLDLYKKGKAGDALSLEAFRRLGFYLGIALAGLVNVINPEVIVIGGGASAAWDLFIEELRSQIKKRAFPLPGERVKIVPASLGDSAGILGAARLAFDSQAIAAV